MTFGHEIFPRTKDIGCSKYARFSYYHPRIHYTKRAYPWPMDATGPGISSNKKQAVEAATNRLDFLQWSAYPWNNPSNHHSTLGQVRGGLVLRPSQFVVPLGTSIMSTGRKDFKDACQGDASVNSQKFSEILKPKVDHVCDSETGIAAPLSKSFGKADDGRLLRRVGCNSYYGSFLSLGRPCQIEDENNKPMDLISNEGLELNLTLGHNYEKSSDIIVSGRANEGPVVRALGMVVADNKAILDDPNYAHLSRATSQMNTVESNAHHKNISVHVICNSRYNSHRTLNCSDKGKGNPVVSGGVKITANDQVMLGNQNSAQSLAAPSWVGTVEPNSHLSLKINSYPGDDTKEQKAPGKKKPEIANEPVPNLYLSSIRKLLSIGIFDGALVQYICESRDLILDGVIKGWKILCSCNKCNNSKYISPCKFERHAGGKTKRPNSHIYFENGATIYEVFNELRSTSEDRLFDVIQKIAGPAVNQLNFHNWKGRPPQ